MGITVFGEPITKVFGEVPKRCYVDSIRNDIKDSRAEIMNNPMTVVLNLCRALAYITDNLIISKEQGGSWALDNLPYEYCTIVKRALYCYKAKEDMVVDLKEAQKFCNYILERTS